MELTCEDRLKIHLLLHYPNVKLKHVNMSYKPGFLKHKSGLIDIRGASYGTATHHLRLWEELHDYFTQHIELVQAKNGQPTLILWNGMVFHLDQVRTYRSQERRNHRKRERIYSTKNTNKVVK